MSKRPLPAIKHRLGVLRRELEEEGMSMDGKDLVRLIHIVQDLVKILDKDQTREIKP